MASEVLEKLFKESLEIDPYQDREFLSDAVGDPPNPIGGEEVRQYWSNTLAFYGKNLWRWARIALNYWTPERVEQEAYRRADDQATVSKIATEVARFNVIYEKWVESAQEFLYMASLKLPGANFAGVVTFMRESIAETLLALERRAQAAEQRATDLRLRYEFDKLRAVVSGRNMASEIAALIQEALKNAGSERPVYEQFAPTLARLEKELHETKLDVVYVADLATDEFGKKLLPMSRVRPVAAKLAEMAGSGLVAKVLALLGIVP